MKDEHTYAKKVARKGRTEVIYKGTFISKQSLEFHFSVSLKTEMTVTLHNVSSCDAHLLLQYHRTHQDLHRAGLCSLIIAPAAATILGP